MPRPSTARFSARSNRIESGILVMLFAFLFSSLRKRAVRNSTLKAGKRRIHRRRRSNFNALRPSVSAYRRNKRRHGVAFTLLCLALAVPALGQTTPRFASRVVIVSVDGLRQDSPTIMKGNFFSGHVTGTLFARTDP